MASLHLSCERFSRLFLQNKRRPTALLVILSNNNVCLRRCGLSIGYEAGSQALKFGLIPKGSCRVTTPGAQNFVGPNHDADNFFFEPIECLEDGTSSEEALTTVYLDGGIAACQIMEDADAEEVTL